jgi:hypothetical protein
MYSPLKRAIEAWRDALSEPPPETAAHQLQPLQSIVGLVSPNGEGVSLHVEQAHWREKIGSKEVIGRIYRDWQDRFRASQVVLQ